MAKSRLEEKYMTEIKQRLLADLDFSNVMEVPKIEKVVVNVGVKDAVADSKSLQVVIRGLRNITGQQPVKTLARKSIAGFKLREDMPIGVMVTLRKKNAYEFLDRLITIALPKTRDFQGVSPRFDGRGNYNLGIKEWTIFPEIDYDISEKIFGLNVTIVTSAKKDEDAKALLKAFGMPFRKV
jgi:large subunit ribosomal protein L5